MPLDLDAAKELDGRLNFQKTQYLKLGPGKHQIRIVPAPEGMKLPWLEYKASSNVGPKNRMVTPSTNPSDENPIAEEIKKLEALGDAASLERAKRLRPKSVFAMFVIKRGEESKGPQLWSASARAVRNILQYVMDTDNGDITDPATGRDIVITGTPKPGGGGQTFTDYTFSLKTKQTELGDPSWTEENLFEVHKVGRVTDPAYIRAALAGTEDEFNASRKAARQQEQEGSSDLPFEQAASTVPTNRDAAVEAQLEKVRNRNKPQGAAMQSLDDILGPK